MALWVGFSCGDDDEQSHSQSHYCPDYDRAVQCNSGSSSLLLVVATTAIHESRLA